MPVNARWPVATTRDRSVAGNSRGTPVSRGPTTETRPRTTTTPTAGDLDAQGRVARGTRPRRAYRLARNLFLLAALVVVVAAGVILGIDNQTPVTVRFLNKEAEWPVFWWLCAAFGCGVLLGLALSVASLVRSRFNQRSLRRSLRQRENELDRLRDQATPPLQP